MIAEWSWAPGNDMEVHVVRVAIQSEHDISPKFLIMNCAPGSWAKKADRQTGTCRVPQIASYGVHTMVIDLTNNALGSELL